MLPHKCDRRERDRRDSGRRVVCRRLGLAADSYNFGPPPVRLLVQLELEYTDGTRDSVVSDESWKATQSPILASEIYDGESYDARLEQNGWDQPSFSDGRWGAVVAAARPEAPLVAQDFQPIRRMRRSSPRRLPIQSRACTFLISARTWSVGRDCMSPARQEPKSKSGLGKS